MTRRVTPTPMEGSRPDSKSHPQIPQITQMSPESGLRSPIAHLRLTFAIRDVVCSRDYALGVRPYSRQSANNADAPDIGDMTK
jgi:hypothetical protein